MSLIGDKWQKHPIVTGPEAPSVPAIGCLRGVYFKDPNGYQWVFSVATVTTEKSNSYLSCLTSQKTPSLRDCCELRNSRY